MTGLEDLNDPRGLFDIIPNPDQQSLTQPSVVDALLRGWAKKCCDTVAAVMSGEDRDAAFASLIAEAERLQGVFYGQDEAYKGTSWNQPQNLGRYLMKTLGTKGPADEMVVITLRAFWNELHPSAEALNLGRITMEMFTEVVAEEVIERYRYYLMGRPLPEGYWGDERDGPDYADPTD